MQDKNLGWKLAFIGLVIVWAVYQIWPPDKKLKGGIDLVGGYSLLYEIDTTGLKSTAGLASRVMERLKQRVDPDGVRNLVWRPVGDTRLEIQMPFPSRETIEARKRFKDALDQLVDTNINIGELERILGLPKEVRSAKITGLIRGIEPRRKLLEEIVRVYDAWREAQISGDLDKARGLQEDYEGLLDELLATNIDVNELSSVLELDVNLKERKERLDEIINRYPYRRPLIEQVIARYSEWSKVKGPLDNPEDLMRLLRGQGVLEFHILPVPSADNPNEFADYIKRLEERGPRVRPDDEFAWYEIAKPDAITVGIRRKWNNKWWVLAYYKDPDKVLDRSKPDWKLVEAFPTRDSNGMPAVGFEFNDVGASYFLELTRNNIGKPLCIILDGKAISAPRINSAISKHGIIEGRFTDEEIRYLVNTLNAGSLDARLKDTPIAIRSIGPSLGEDNRRAGFKASLYALIAVVAFMAIYYLWAGLIADFALFMNLLLLLGLMAALEATFTMAGIAGVILTLGMAVDANVLIYERMREESEKIQSLKLIIKNGYDKALSTILDANITTLITCVILYYIGTEEIKGFALTLGIGLVVNMFTALFVTRVIFNFLAKYNVIKSLPMLRLIGNPKVDWLAKQRYFWTLSFGLIVAALVLFPLKGKEKYDIEFRGGTAVQIKLKSAGLLDISKVRELIKQAGDELAASSRYIDTIKITPVEGRENTFILKFNGISVDRLEAAILSFMEDKIEKGSLEIIDSKTISFKLNLPSSVKVDIKELREILGELKSKINDTGLQLAAAQVQSVGTDNLRYEIVTVATAERLIIDAIVSKLGPYLDIQLPIRFSSDIKYYPIMKKSLREVVGDSSVPGYFPDCIGGVAFVVDGLDPASTTDIIRNRIASMRLQPDFENLQWRRFEVIGIKPASGQDLINTPDDKIRYTKVAIVVYDPNYLYDEDPVAWEEHLVKPELRLIKESLSRTSPLEQVTQFAAQVAHQARNSAILALLVAFFAMVVYLWIRFGTARHGIAAIIALLHDVCVAIAFFMIATLLYNTAIGKALMLDDFKINLAVVAAILTIIGYSVNDTIVVYDRIRENKGKREIISADIINRSINQTLSRTVLTSLTTLIVMIILYIWGGEGVHGFSYVMIIGIVSGTYSSIAIASPLLIGWFGTLFRGSGSQRSAGDSL